MANHPSAASLKHEWLLTNGTGAFAMGTLAGVNTRRYHGLLIAATQPPLGRIVALNQMLEHLAQPGDGGPGLPLTTCQFRGEHGEEIFAPDSRPAWRQIRRGDGIEWHYQYGALHLIRSLRLHWKQQAATLSYRIEGDVPAGAVWRLAPMLTLRDFHALRYEDGKQPRGEVSAAGDSVTVRMDGPGPGVGPGVAVTLRCVGSVFKIQSDWWRRIFYAADHERGQGDREDYFVPGYFEIGAGTLVALTVALGETAADTTDEHRSPRPAHLQEIAEKLSQSLPAADAATLAPALVRASDDFVVDRFVGGHRLSTILAGYPWFGDWGRDTFIALPGLLLATGRLTEARDTLSAFAHAIRDGLVPNLFDDRGDGGAHYNTVDASLWFIVAALQYMDLTQDRASWRDWLRPAVRRILDAYEQGTRFNIAMQSDGLISAGDADTQLTWMDAKCQGVVFTPRQGKAVEINALWHHALTGVAQALTEDDPAAAKHYKTLAARAKRSFPRVFWNPVKHCLFDHVWVDAQGRTQADGSIRPNQILAASLEHSPLPVAKRRSVLKVVGEKLLTPMGLRTLPVDDPNYHGRYSGPQRQRDEAYHQGTIWPWLIGPYAEAVWRCGRRSVKAWRQARAALQPLVEQLLGPGQGQLHEIHEADPPHRPVGCIAQAWSVAEVLRVLALLGDEGDDKVTR